MKIKSTITKVLLTVFLILSSFTLLGQQNARITDLLSWNPPVWTNTPPIGGYTIMVTTNTAPVSFVTTVDMTNAVRFVNVNNTNTIPVSNVLSGLQYRTYSLFMRTVLTDTNVYSIFSTNLVINYIPHVGAPTNLKVILLPLNQ